MSTSTCRMLRVKAVAEHFDVSLATIYRAIESGQLYALKLGTGRGTLRVPEAALESFAEACAQVRDEQCSRTETTGCTGYYTRRPHDLVGGDQS